MVFSLLISAIIWNLGTWYMGLPASSSHSLIGAIMGVGLANSLMAPGHQFGEGVNWPKVSDTFIALFTSPIVGFVFAGLLLLLAKALIRVPALYEAPKNEAPPPAGVRALLIFTCTAVSFFHGSNDGQKGQGLIMLILIGVLPGSYALQMQSQPKVVQQLVASSQATADAAAKKANGAVLDDKTADKVLSDFVKSSGKYNDQIFPAVSAKAHAIVSVLNGKDSFSSIDTAHRRDLRSDLYLVSTSLGKLVKQKKFEGPEAKAATEYSSLADHVTKYIPVWVKVAVALALGIGTMVGWKRIVVTVGEKIGKAHLTYGQGAAAELVAAGTIGLADHYGLPVSTTHILSSGVAGTMAANGSGLQKETLRNILLAWVLTLPVCVLLGAGLFSSALVIIFNVLGLH
jgi:PiT family inorganic phosphate transporter